MKLILLTIFIAFAYAKPSKYRIILKSFKNDDAILFIGIEENLLHDYKYDAGNTKEK